MADDDYEVGYKRPPKKSRFEKGQSGNPKGRPKKKDITFYDALKNELSQVIPIKEGQEVKELTKSEALIKQLTNKAVKGDIRAITLLEKLKWKYDPEEKEATHPVIPQIILSPSDECSDPDCPSHNKDEESED